MIDCPQAIERSRRIAAFVLILIVPIALAGCDIFDRGRTYPPVMTKMLQHRFLADGRIHVQHHGKFRIAPNTGFCVYSPGLKFDENMMQKHLSVAGQSDYVNGSSRLDGIFGEKISTDCGKKATVNTVFMRGYLVSGSHGPYYKITFALWQGASAWVGLVERTDGIRSDAALNSFPTMDGPSFFGPTVDEVVKRQKRVISIYMDDTDLTAAFLDSAIIENNN